MLKKDVKYNFTEITEPSRRRFRNHMLYGPFSVNAKEADTLDLYALSFNRVETSGVLHRDVQKSAVFL